MQNHRKDGPHANGATQGILAALRSVYGEQGRERDAFGRRTALPSEVADVLGRTRRATSESEEQK